MILAIIALFFVFLALRELCSLKKLKNPRETYADQVMHGVAGGIAGPILDPSLFDYDAPRYPLPAERRAIFPRNESHATALWAMPPEPPA